MEGSKVNVETKYKKKIYEKQRKIEKFLNEMNKERIIHNLKI